MRRVLFFRDTDQNLAIDEGDYLIVRDFVRGVQTRVGIPEAELVAKTREIVRVEERDERRVCALNLDLEQRWLPCYLSCQLPSNIGHLTSLTELSIIMCRVTSLPYSFWSLHKLTNLYLFCPSFAWLPDEIGNLKQLERLSVDNSKIASLPSSMRQLKKLEYLSLSNSNLARVPEWLTELPSLAILSLKGSKIKTLPASIGQLKHLRSLDLSFTYISRLPDEIGDLLYLESLSLRHSKIASIPSSIKGLKHIAKLDLGCTGVARKLPAEFWSLTTITDLNLNYTGIERLPESIGAFENLRMLNLSDTPGLLELPEEIGNLKNLEHFNITSSGILRLPSSMKRLSNLKLLDIGCCWESIGFLVLKELVQSCKMLGAINSDRYQRTRPLNLIPWREIDDALAWNRGNSRILSLQKAVEFYTREYTHLAPKLWVNMITHISRAFSFYPDDNWSDEKWHYEIEKYDAIHRLLVLERESFLLLVINRNRIPSF